MSAGVNNVDVTTGCQSSCESVLFEKLIVLDRGSQLVQERFTKNCLSSAGSKHSVPLYDASSECLETFFMLNSQSNGSPKQFSLKLLKNFSAAVGDKNESFLSMVLLQYAEFKNETTNKKDIAVIFIRKFFTEFVILLLQ